MINLEKRKVLITGAASGIGRTLAKRFSEMGASLILLDINPASMKRINPKAELIKCDISKTEEIDKIAKTKLSGVDILFNNAGIGARDSFADQNFGEFEKTMDVNFMGLAYLTKRYLNSRSKSKESYIVNISSIAGAVPIPLMSAYGGSKAAVNNFSRLLNMELHDTYIRVMVAICGPAKTDFGKGFKKKVDHSRFYDEYIRLSPEEITEKIISGIRKNRNIVFIPWYMKYFALFGNMFPGIYDFIVMNSLKRKKV